jgi:hypothetical protein
VDGRLFGSVTNADIAEALAGQGFKLEKSQVRMPSGPLKTVGDHPVSVLHTDVVVDVTVSVLGEHVCRTPRSSAPVRFGVRDAQKGRSRAPAFFVCAAFSAAIIAPMNAPAADPQLDSLKVPPHSIEAEQSVLGGLLLDNAAWDRIADFISEADFYRFDHRLIFQSIARLISATKPADVITVFEMLQGAGKAEEVGGLAYLNSLAQTRRVRPISAVTRKSCANVRCCASS